MKLLLASLIALTPVSASAEHIEKSIYLVQKIILVM